VVLTFTMW